MFKRLTIVAAAIVFATLTAFGTTGSAAATTVPDASCVNSDPLGQVNVVVCTINTTLQVPVDVPVDSVITIGNGIHTIQALTRAELNVVELIIEDLLNSMDVEDERFQQALCQALVDSGILEGIGVHDITVALL